VKDRLGVYMLDVGQGDSTVVLLPDDRVVVFDCADDHVLRKILESWGRPPIAAFVLSHLDQDHIAGALQFLKGWTGPIDAVYLSTDRDVEDEHDEAKRAKLLLDHVKEQSRDEGARRRRWELLPSSRDPRPLASGPGWAVTLLAPSHWQHIEREREGKWEDANRYSSILRVQAGAGAMLIGGDAPLLSWSELPPIELEASVFRVPHHGGALDDGGVPPGWDVERLYTAVGAATALISVGTNNGHEHPRPAWIAPITGGACRLLCTQVTARCHGPLDTTAKDGRRERNAVEIEALRNRVIREQNQWTEPQYRHLTDKRRQVMKGLLEVPCTGTAVVKMHLDGRVEVLPSRGGEHERIVDDWQQPLCRPPDVDGEDRVAADDARAAPAGPRT
jgi:beta-lactamase superfamily II metal-dependent hydrolase